VRADAVPLAVPFPSSLSFSVDARATAGLAPEAARARAACRSCDSRRNQSVREGRSFLHETRGQIDKNARLRLTLRLARLSYKSSSKLVVTVDDTLEELVARARRGERRAFEAIIRQHLRPAYAVALAVLQRPTDAEDVAQEALIVALERIDSLRDARQFRSWLLQIVRNQALNWRGRRQLRDVPRETPPEPVHDASLPDALAFRFRLLEAMAVLGSTEREVVLLHDLEGWTHVEIAEALDISVVMSRQHLFQARRKLRARLEARREEGDHE